jgi:BarA-like signal transduction histidine kinase
MGTKMAPCFASLFMDKLQKDFIDSCYIKPLIWLRFLDDILFNWNHSEEYLFQFIDRLNNYNDNIKFTYCFF